MPQVKPCSCGLISFQGPSQSDNMPTSTSRTPAIDMAKGLACMAIVWHHLAFYGPMSDIAQPLAPALIAWLYDYGRMAVQVFLVLGGYLAAASLAPQGVARFDHAGTAIAKRFVRLVVPHGDRGVFRYTVRARSFRSPSFAWAESTDAGQESRHYRAMAQGSGSDQQHDVTGYTREQLINDLLNAYARFRHARRLS